jgi:hypothetical protein
MIDIKKEGYVSVMSNQIPLRNYLFYLTYSDRAQVTSHMDKVDFNSTDIYSTTRDYINKRTSEARNIYKQDKGEMVMSFSPELCQLVVKNKFDNNLNKFKQDFSSTCDEILKNNLEQKEYAIFIHEYDSTQMRVHAHVLFYPYLEQSEEIKVKNSTLKIRPPKIWVEPEILDNIKQEFNNYAHDLFDGLEGMPSELSSDVKLHMDTLFYLINLSNLTANKFPLSDLDSKWQKPEIKRIKSLIRLLEETSDDNVINEKRDFTLVVDYLYDFDDQDVYNLFFNHGAIKSIIRDFSLNKSISKFSSCFLKLIHLTTDENIIKLIKKKITNSKGNELRNILTNSFAGDTDLVQSLERTRIQNQNIT